MCRELALQCFSFTLIPLQICSIFSCGRSRKCSTRSPSINPSADLVLVAAVCSIAKQRYLISTVKAPSFSNINYTGPLGHYHYPIHWTRLGDNRYQIYWTSCNVYTSSGKRMDNILQQCVTTPVSGIGYILPLNFSTFPLSPYIPSFNLRLNLVLELPGSRIIII